MTSQAQAAIEERHAQLIHKAVPQQSDRTEQGHRHQSTRGGTSLEDGLLQARLRKNLEPFKVLWTNTKDGKVENAFDIAFELLANTIPEEQLENTLFVVHDEAVGNRYANILDITSKDVFFKQLVRAEVAYVCVRPNDEEYGRLEKPQMFMEINNVNEADIDWIGWMQCIVQYWTTFGAGSPGCVFRVDL